jgi:hypothetical protein
LNGRWGGPDDRESKKLLRRVVTVLVAGWLLASVVIFTVSHVHESDAKRKADDRFQQAQEQTGPDTTPEDATRWLEQNEAELVAKGEKRWINGQESDFHTIIGERKLNAKGLWTTPMTAELRYVFNDDWRFKEVELHLHGY